MFFELGFLRTVGEPLK